MDRWMDGSEEEKKKKRILSKNFQVMTMQRLSVIGKVTGTAFTAGKWEK